MARNILFVMCDQLRFDYLSCYGHPHLETPNIDRIAREGVRFDRAYVQSPICGPSRMSFYTGRYVRSHGSTWNGYPLRVGELTLGDHLRPLGMRSVLVGKTHMKTDLEGMARLGIDPDSTIGVHVAQCGFEPFERDDGLHPDGPYDPESPYNRHLQAAGYNDPNPWNSRANAAEGDAGEVLSGWLMRYANRPARIAEEHSETPHTTRRAMQFIDQAGDTPWCLHLSYIKPHWPYIVPAPYHAMYGPETVQPAIRSEDERRDPHPVYRAFMDHREARAFARDEVRARVIPAYMGLIKQIDDQLGVLFTFLEERGLFDETLIVFTSDHGDYLGDHWLGEKELFHEMSVKIPLLIRDPDPAADATRGTVSDALVEAIDLVPTFVEHAGGEVPPHQLEGRSLRPWLHGQAPASWREHVISEYDYGMREARVALDVPIADARLVMIADQRWKYVLAEGFRPILFDRESDPDEFHDLGADPAHAEVRARLHEILFAWARRHHQRTTVSDAEIAAHTGKQADVGILIGYWDESELGQD